MKEWKIRQYVYHSTNSDYTDDLNKVDIIYNENDIVQDALLHFTQHVENWLYPAKSYFVAICYAYWLSKDYGEDFYEVLNDPELLYNNDPYFKTYSQDPETYDTILDQIKLLPMTGMVPDVRKYYEAECGLELSMANSNIQDVDQL